MRKALTFFLLALLIPQVAFATRCKRREPWRRPSLERECTELPHPGQESCFIFTARNERMLECRFSVEKHADISGRDLSLVSDNEPNTLHASLDSRQCDASRCIDARTSGTCQQAVTLPRVRKCDHPLVKGVLASRGPPGEKDRSDETRMASPLKDSVTRSRRSGLSKSDHPNRSHLGLC